MIINGPDFKMEHNVGYFFDLYLMKTINKGKEGKERQEMTLEHYGIPFETGIKLIITNRLLGKEYSLQEYTEAYKQEVTNILKEISW